MSAQPRHSKRDARELRGIQEEGRRGAECEGRKGLEGRGLKGRAGRGRETEAEGGKEAEGAEEAEWRALWSKRSWKDAGEVQGRPEGGKGGR